MNIKNILDTIISFFFKKEVNYPDEFVVIKFTDQAKKNGIYLDESKEMVWFKYNDVTGVHDEFRVFNYSEILISTFREKAIALLDTTKDISKMNILKKIRPEVLTFEREV